jgi:hypothetical protein
VYVGFADLGNVDGVADSMQWPCVLHLSFDNGQVLPERNGGPEEPVASAWEGRVCETGRQVTACTRRRSQV